MIRNHPHICLYQPEIPQNTGNIGRLAAGTGSRLHLIKPFGFSTSDKNLRRAGLDYWPFLDLEIHDTLEDLLQMFPGKFAFLSKKAQKPFFDIPDSCELLIFGKETTGLPSEQHEKYPEDFYKIPMYHPGVRSLNLANAVSAVIYDRIRRLHHQV